MGRTDDGDDRAHAERARPSRHKAIGYHRCHVEKRKPPASSAQRLGAIGSAMDTALVESRKAALS
jgi:hypothetical protein